MKHSVVRVGIIGLGLMGQNHLRNLSMLKQVEVVFIYDFNKDSCASLALEYDVRVSDNLERG